MFFPRLRRQAKWMFIFLALVFGLGFVVFGVGSGGGLGLGDVLDSLRTSSSGPSVSDARKKVDQNPDNPAAWRELANALQRDTDHPFAPIEPLQRYVILRPKDQQALQQLGSLQYRKGIFEQRLAYNAQIEGQLAAPQVTLIPGLMSPQGAQVLQDPISQAAAQYWNERTTRAGQRAQTTLKGAVSTYRQLAQLEPRDANAQLQLGQVAQQANDLSTAISAYKRFLKLAPDDPNAPLVKQQLKQLAAAGSGQLPVTAGG